jgi:hypothetical protein
MRVFGLRLRFVGLAALVMTLSGCQSPAGGLRPWGWRQPPDSSNVVMRPSYEWPNTKLLYVSGYAGADYGMVRPRGIPAGSVAPALPASPPAVTIHQGEWNTE